MPERLDHRQLHPQTRQALRLAQQIAGQRPRPRQADHLEGEVNALLRQPARRGRPFEIVYRAGQGDILDHLIAHEVGHLIRLYRVPEGERLLAAIEAPQRERAALQLVDEIPAILAERYAVTLPDFLIQWQQDVATQVANFPTDLRIEQWIHDRYPGLSMAT